MKQAVLTVIRRPELQWLKQVAFFLRGVLYLGTRFKCPVCGWRMRAFVDREGIFNSNHDGYCPRCNAKARHRRLWLFLDANTHLFTDQHELLEVAPWSALGQRLQKFSNLRYTGLDLDPDAACATVAGDLQSVPLDSGSFDAILCIHVLEHVDDDRAAMREIQRLLKPQGWAIVSVPLLLDETTREDPTITSPADRERVFGEKDHVRYYGTDFQGRLEAAGLQVKVNWASSIPDTTRSRYGLRDDENLFVCRSKP